MTTNLNKCSLNTISDIITKFETKNRKRNESKLPTIIKNEIRKDVLHLKSDNLNVVKPKMYKQEAMKTAKNYPFFENEQFSNSQTMRKDTRKFGPLFELLSWLPLSLLSVTGMGVASFLAALILPRAICQCILYPGFRLLFGTLYPAYASYKAIRTKNVKEYVSFHEMQKKL